MNPKFGLIPNDPSKPRLYFSSFRKPGAVAPPTVNYYGVPDLGMLGNDQYGDCVFAGNGHIAEEQTFYGQGTETVITTADVLSEYSRVTGFNPGPPVRNDNGAMIQDGLNDFRKNGLAGSFIAAFAEVTNIADVKLAVAEFGVVDIGFRFPASAMSQFNAGRPWDVVSNDGGIEGGHCVVVLGYGSTYLYVATWGTVQKMTYAFWNRYVDEAWAVVSPDWVNAVTGLDPLGVDKYTFGAQYAALTGQANPFPAPVPPPVADPTASALAAYARTWLKTPRTRADLAPLAADLRAWLVAHPEL